MIDINPSVNLLNPSYCYNCGKENIPTWNVRLSHRCEEELCEDCIGELNLMLENVLLGQDIKKATEKKWS